MRTYKEVITTKNGTKWLITLGRVSTYKYKVLDSRPIINKGEPVTSDGNSPDRK